MGLAIRLSSDFKDYYDEELNLRENSRYLKNVDRTIIFDRKLNDREHRTLDLRFLQSNGINVLGLKPVSSFQLLPYDTKLLVYTQPCVHCGNGKLVLDNREAQELYPNIVSLSIGAAPKYAILILPPS